MAELGDGEEARMVVVPERVVDGRVRKRDGGGGLSVAVVRWLWWDGE